MVAVAEWLLRQSMKLFFAGSIPVSHPHNPFKATQRPTGRLEPFRRSTGRPERFTSLHSLPEAYAKKSTLGLGKPLGVISLTNTTVFVYGEEPAKH